jgi:CheY-like chemotaxis protein
MRRICVADDDEGIRESFRFLLDETDTVVEEVTDGEALLVLLRGEPARRVVILDRMMPRLDGTGVLRVLEHEPELQARTSVVFCTARNDPPDADLYALMKATTVADVRKPFLLDDLLAAIDQGWARLAQPEEGPAGG